MSYQPDRHTRSILPIPDQVKHGLTTYDAKDPDTHFPPIRELRPPEGAPNVLIVLLDDVGFGASSTFGGPCETPNFDRLAANGLRYNRFHTTALCSPTRQALLTGPLDHNRIPNRDVSDHLEPADPISQDRADQNPYLRQEISSDPVDHCPRGKVEILAVCPPEVGRLFAGDHRTVGIK